MANSNLQVGPIASTSSIAVGQQPVMRGGNMGDLIMSELQGRYYEACYRRVLFSAASQAAVATVGLGTTAYTGLSICNPIGSTVNLILLKFSYGITAAASGAAMLGLETGYNSGTNVTHTAAATITSNFIGVGAAGTGLVDTSSTLPTAPTARMVLAQVPTTAVASLTFGPTQVIDLEGSIILPPGAYAAPYTSTVNTAAWWFSWFWMEVPA